MSYGALDVYLQAAGLPSQYKSWLHLPHSIYHAGSIAALRQSEIALRSYSGIIANNDSDAKLFSEVCGHAKNIVILPHAFCYVQKHYESQSEEIKREGSVFFYPHSLTGAPPPLSMQAIKDKLSSLPDLYHPIDICLHYNDISPEKSEYFLRHGFSCVSAGSPDDEFFMHRIYTILNRRKVSISCDYGTHIFYSVLAGCQVELVRDLPVLNFFQPIYYPQYDLINPLPHYMPFFLELQKTVPNKEVLFNAAKRLTSGGNLVLGSELKQIFENEKKCCMRIKSNRANLRLPPAFYRYIFDPIYFRVKGWLMKLGLLFLGRTGYYVNPAFMIDHAIKYVESWECNDKKTAETKNL